MDRFASFWGAVLDTVPGAHAAVNTVTRLFGKSMTEPQPTLNRGWGVDPNGVFDPGTQPPPPTASGQT
jgi:hypothetical protein